MASAELLRAFERQASGCRGLDASFTADVVETLADQLRSAGPLAGLLPDWPGDPWADAVPLRLCGALHAQALSEDSPLHALYPPRAKSLDRDALIRELNASLERDNTYYLEMLRRPPQTK